MFPWAPATPMNAPANRTFEGWVNGSSEYKTHQLTELFGWNPVMDSPVIAMRAWKTTLKSAH